jgi:hypothetical protein
MCKKRIETLTENEMYDLMYVTPILSEGALKGVEVNADDSDRIYEIALDYFMKRVVEVEIMDIYDFSSFDDEEEAWYDKCREVCLDGIRNYLTKRYSENDEDIEDLILDSLCYCEFRGELETSDILTNIVGKEARCYDHYIDDGCADDEEDSYVMCASFTFEGREMDVLIYYGDNTLDVGYIGIR